MITGLKLLHIVILVCAYGAISCATKPPSNRNPARETPSLKVSLLRTETPVPDRVLIKAIICADMLADVVKSKEFSNILIHLDAVEAPFFVGTQKLGHRKIACTVEDGKSLYDWRQYRALTTVILDTHTLEQTPERASVEGWYSYGDVGGSSFTYELRKSDGEWVIVAKKVGPVARLSRRWWHPVEAGPRMPPPRSGG